MEPKTAYKYSVIAALCGAAASTYLLVHHILLHLGLQEGPSLCSVNAYLDCDRVAMSKYAEFLGVPVAAYGLFYFLLFLLLQRVSKDRVESAETWAVFRFFSLCGLIPVIILASISLSQLQTICIVCASTYVITLFLGAIAFRVKETGPKSSLLLGMKGFVGYFIPTGQPQFSSGLLLTALLGAVVVLFLPTVVMSAYKPVTPIDQTESAEDRAVRAWRAEPVSMLALRAIADGPERDFELGDPSAPVTVTTYSDFSCPHCQVMAEFFEKTVTELPIHVLFKNFPLDKACNPIIDRSFHDSSCRAALIARCAGAKDDRLFWKAHDLLFALEAVNDNTLKTVTDKLQSDDPQILQCVDSSEQMPALKRHIDEAIELKLPGTPGVFVEGKRVEALNANVLRRIIQEALNKK